MINLRERYANVLSEMKADAELNMEEARKAVKDRGKSYIDALSEAKEEKRQHMYAKYKEALNALKLAEYELACIERFF